jgi:hypothetical protein
MIVSCHLVFEADFLILHNNSRHNLQRYRGGQLNLRGKKYQRMTVTAEGESE